MEKIKLNRVQIQYIESVRFRRQRGQSVFDPVFEMCRQGLTFYAESNAHVFQFKHAVPEQRVGVEKVEDAIIFQAILGSIDQFERPVDSLFNI